MRKVFLDVGAHVGQTLNAAMRWDFDIIHCFEPVTANVKHLLEIGDSRTYVHPVGLWNKSESRPLYDAGSQGASLWKRPNRSRVSEMCTFIRASDWFAAHLHSGDQVWMKLNAEGAELDIITDLLDSGEFEKISYTLVMWDAHKIPAVSRGLEAVRSRLGAKYSSPRVISSKEIASAVSHVGRIDSWINMTEGAKKR